MQDQLLSKNFLLSELTASQTAARNGIDNTPDFTVIGNLSNLTRCLLQPLRDLLKTPIVISSGYRSPALNAAVGGVSKSEHMTGCAADIVVPGKSNIDLAKFIVNNSLPFNQIILEFYRSSDPFYGWVHVSYSAAGNKGEIFTFDGKTYSKGLPT